VVNTKEPPLRDLPGGIKMFSPGPWELLIILLIVLIIFGAGKLPEIGAGLGKGIKNFKKATSGKDEIDVTPSQSETASTKEENKSQSQAS
jgi:sec-independent protein translocase protein TatA